MNKLQKEKDDLLKKSKGQKSSRYFSSSTRYRIQSKDEYSEEEDQSKIEDDIDEILRKEEYDFNNMPSLCKARIYYKKKK